MTVLGYLVPLLLMCGTFIAKSALDRLGDYDSLLTTSTLFVCLCHPEYVMHGSRPVLGQLHQTSHCAGGASESSGTRERAGGRGLRDGSRQPSHELITHSCEPGNSILISEKTTKQHLSKMHMDIFKLIAWLISIPGWVQQQI